MMLTGPCIQNCTAVFTSVMHSSILRQLTAEKLVAYVLTVYVDATRIVFIQSATAHECRIVWLTMVLQNPKGLEISQIREQHGTKIQCSIVSGTLQ